jgi:ATP-binding cassette subfamily B protein
MSQVTGVAMASYTPGSAVSGLVTNSIQFIQIIAALTVLCWFEWSLAILMLAAGLWWARESRRYYLSQTKTLARQATRLRRSGYLRDLVLHSTAAKEIRLFGLTDWLIDQFRAEWNESMNAIRALRGVRTTRTVAALLIFIGANFFAFATLATNALHDVIGVGAAVIFLRSVILVGQVSTPGQHDLTMAYGLSALPAVAAIEKVSARKDERLGAAPPPGASGVQLDLQGISFQYPNGATPVLKDLNLTIPRSASLAIVGANGAGKTTLIKLICRFYDPDGGEILADGTNLRKLDARGWQRQVSAVFQDFQRFELPARDNVGFGAIQLREDETALRSAASRANILGRIDSLPDGWDTPLARHISGGADLSGGEWQRIALARAMLAVEAGARLLILDEPTASLDVRAESTFYDQFLNMTQAVTTIIISHRFSTVRRADAICVLSNGTVAELGTHEELMAAGKQYSQMYTAQSARFEESGRTPTGARFPHYEP